MAIFKLQDGTKFYQWDVKRKLIVTDDRIDQVHFTNSTLEQAIVVPVYEVEGIRMADVPSTLLKVGCNITAYAFIYQEDKEYTLLHEVIGVTPRKQPDDYIPEDEEMRWATLQEEVLAAAEAAKTSEQNAHTAAENAGTSEQNALTAAGDAAESKEAAENAAIVAGTSAETAASAASAAAGSATTAAESEQKVITAASTATTKAEEAAASAELAVASATAAGKSETNASASETAAKESETNSKASETNAQASAEAAEASAKAAADSAAAIKEYDILAGNYAAAADASAKAAAASAAEAKASETVASESAATATAKAAEAAGSATVAQDAKTAAEAAAEAAEQAKNEVAEFAGGDFTTNTAFNAHKEDTTVHITAAERTAWNGKAESDHNHDGVYAPKEHNHSQYLTEHQDISGKADKSDLTSHTGNTTVHITAAERTAWNNKSNFSGNYNDLTNKPTIPTVSVKSVNGKTGAVVLSASDVGASPSGHNHDEKYAPKDHTHAVDWEDIQNKPEDIGGGKADSVDWEDVQNKPFGTTWSTLIDNQTFAYDESQAAYFMSENALLTDGNRYEIVINGTAYTEGAADYMGVAVCIGNPAAFGGADNGKLFCVTSMAGTGTAMVFLDGSTSPATITLRECVAKKIDPIYIEPPKVYYITDSSNYLYHDVKCEGAKVTAAEFMKAIQNGMPMISCDNTTFYLPTMTQNFGTCVTVRVFESLTQKLFYTAEYTG